MESEEFLSKVAQAFGTVSPSDDDISTVLTIASVAAHSSERKMAPIVCWLSAKAGISPNDALEIVSRVVDGQLS